jgi:hypothetical protein
LDSSSFSVEQERQWTFTTGVRSGPEAVTVALDEERT